MLLQLPFTCSLRIIVTAWMSLGLGSLPVRGAAPQWASLLREASNRHKTDLGKVVFQWGWKARLFWHSSGSTVEFCLFSRCWFLWLRSWRLLEVEAKCVFSYSLAEKTEICGAIQVCFYLCPAAHGPRRPLKLPDHCGRMSDSLLNAFLWGSRLPAAPWKLLKAFSSSLPFEWGNSLCGPCHWLLDEPVCGLLTALPNIPWSL